MLINRRVLLLGCAAGWVLAAASAQAGRLTASDFQTYTAAAASSIQAGPFALYSVGVDQIQPAQLNVGFNEVGNKTAGWDLLSASQLQSALLTDIEPVVIGPGGALYLENGHHTFTSLEDSIYGASDPNVYVDVVANYSNLTTAQFWAQMEASDLVLPLNDGVPETINTATGAPVPTSLQALTNDPYRGLEYSILKNKSSKLFPTTSNITGAKGSSIPGLDKLTGDYSDFIWADAYRGANGGLGLPYLTPGDIALATQWNLNPSSATTIPGVGAVTVAQLPGSILNQSLTISSTISNATLATGTLDANGGFTGITSFTLGTGEVIGTLQSGFVMQLGADAGNTVTLSGANTYTGGTTIIAGTLIVANDSALGAAAPASYTINPANILTSVEAANGIIFNSEDEGAATLQIGTTSGGGTATYSTNRPIAVDGETATIDVNGYVTTLTGQLVSLGTNGSGLGNESGVSDLTIDDNSSSLGVLVLTTASPNFYGNIIVGDNNKPTLRVSSDAELGNTTGPADEIGEVVLNGGTFQAGASFSSVRNFAISSKSTFDTAGYVTSFAGTFVDDGRGLTVTNSNMNTGVGAGVGAVSFGSLEVGSDFELTVNKASGTSTSVTFTNGITRDPNAVLFLTGTTLGATAKVFSSGASTTLTNGIVAPWIIIDGGSSANDEFDFASYGSINGYVAYAGYTNATSGSGISSSATSQANATAVVKTADKAGTVAVASNTFLYALNVSRGTTLTGSSLTLGDGVDPAGLILNGTNGNAINVNVTNLNFGGSEGVITVAGSQTSAIANVINSTVNGSGGLTIAGNGMLTFKTASTETGAIVVDSGTLNLAAANVFSASSGLTLSNAKNFAAANLTLNQTQTFSALNGSGNNSTILIDSTGTNGGSTGTQLIIGNSKNQSSTINSIIYQDTATADPTKTLVETGNAVAGVITKNGAGLLDLSGMSSGTLDLATGSTIVVNGGQLRVTANSFVNANGITLASGTELQFAEGGGSIFAGNITGSGLVRLIGGTLKLTGTGNTYTGGTAVETGSTLDLTTANVSSGNANISDAGGLIVFDQTTSGIYSGVISDGLQMSVGSKLSGSVVKDDSTGANSGNVTFNEVQTYTGATTIEAGTITLGVVNAIADSSGVNMGRVGGGATAGLILNASNSIGGLSSEAGNTTSVSLGNSTLAINQASGSLTFSGTISGAGAVIKSGGGLEIFDGNSTYTGGTVISGGALEVGDASHTGASLTGPVTINSGGTLLGHGSITGAVTISSNAVLQPGGTIGTLNVGSANFLNNSTYAVEVSPSATSLLAASGAVTLQSGTNFAVNPDGAIASYARVTDYTVLTAANGVSGTFANATTTVSGFTPILSYGSNAVSLELVKNDLTPLASTPNQLAAAQGLSSDAGSAIFDAIAPQSNAVISQAFNAVSGELHATVAGSLLYDSRFLSDAVQARAMSDSDTSVWANGNARWSHFSGTATSNAASANSALQGVTLGGDTAVMDDIRVGGAAGYSYDRLNVAARASAAKINTTYLGAYADAANGPLAFTAMVSYAWHKINTLRAVDFNGFAQNETSHYTGNTLNLFGEVRSRQDLDGNLYAEPFADINYADLQTRAFQESAGAAALDGKAAARTMVYTTLGARFGTSYDLGDGLTLVPHISMGWDHSGASPNPSANLAFASGGSSFTVLGAPISRDAFTDQAGFDMPLNNGLDVNLFYAGRISNAVTEHSVTADLRFSF